MIELTLCQCSVKLHFTLFLCSVSSAGELCVPVQRQSADVSTHRITVERHVLEC